MAKNTEIKFTKDELDKLRHENDDSPIYILIKLSSI